MPEYSGTTITPADAVQTPAMNGATPGNFTLAALKSYILASKGLANGLAGLDANGKLDPDQIPSSVKNVLVYATRSNFPTPGEAGKIYIARDDATMYFWDETLTTPAYVELSVDLSDYATLDDLQDEADAREAADTNLNNAMTQLDHRVENLEQAKGKYVVNTYKDGAITPSGKGDWAIVEGLRAQSRVDNNIFDASVNPQTVRAGVTVGYDGNYITLNGTATATETISGWFNLYHTQGFAGKAGHKVAISFVVESGTITGSVAGRLDSTSLSPRDSAIVSLVADSGFALIYTSGTVFNNVKISFPCVDLNIYFGGSIPSDADTIAEIQTNYPHLLQPSEYGTRIVDSSYSGVRAWARNLWDEEWLNGYYNYGSGEFVASSQHICSKNYIPVLGGVTYYSMQTGGYVCYYDKDEVFISSIDIAMYGPTFTPPANCAFIMFNCGSAYGATYQHNICINQSDSQNGTYTPYHAPQTLSLTFTGKSAGAVAEMYYPETGEQTKPLGSVDLGTLTYTATTMTNNRVAYTTPLSGLPSQPQYTYNVSPNALCTKFLPTYQSASSWAIGEFVMTTSEGVLPAFVLGFITKDTDYSSASDFKDKMNGVMFNYELATPDPSTFVTPIIDNTLLTEAGGRMATVQTGTVVDGSFDMGFITL